MGRPQHLRESVPGLFRVLHRLWPWMRKQRVAMAWSLAALFGATILGLFEPWPLKFVFDRVIPSASAATSSATMNADSLGTMTTLTLCALGLVVVVALRATMDYFATVGFVRVGNRALQELRNHLYSHVQGLSLSFHTKSRTGDLIVRVTRDVGMLRDVASTAILPLLASVLVLVGMVVVMLVMQWKLALLALATVPLFWFTTVRISRRIHEVAREQRRREGAMAATAAESMAAIKVVQALSLEGVFAQDFSTQNAKSNKQDVKAARLTARLDLTVDLITAVAAALVLFAGTRLILVHEMTIGDLYVFLIYLKRSFHPAKDFAKYAARLAKGTAAGERILEILDRTPDVRDLPGAVTAPAFEGKVEFRDVSFEYETGHPVLRQLDLPVAAGSCVALVGPSGIGKSTLVSLILRLYDPVEGSVTVDGHDLRDYTIASLRSQMSVVLQDNVLFAATVSDNIGYGAAQATRQDIEASARLANADEFIRALPQGYDTVLGERGATLSHGQRQRIAIARAAIRKSPILILDEPTTGLDEENRRVVTDALLNVATGHTTFLVTHDLQLAAMADTILYLENGEIVEQGTHQKLMALDSRYARLYQLQRSDSGRVLRDADKSLLDPSGADRSVLWSQSDEPWVEVDAGEPTLDC